MSNFAPAASISETLFGITKVAKLKEIAAGVKTAGRGTMSHLHVVVTVVVVSIVVVRIVVVAISSSFCPTAIRSVGL